MRIRSCSVVARMPRYGPVPPGIRSTARLPAAGQNGSSGHVPALFDSSSGRINEQSSGLLIRGFGVQVPGGAPGLTWGFTTPGRFLCVRFVHLVAPWLLARTDPAIRACRKRPHSAPDAGACAPGTAPPRAADAAPGSLGQWSRPPARAPGAHPESPIPMSSRSVRPAGKRHSYGGCVAGADTSDGPVTRQGCAGQRQGASGWRCRLRRRSKRQVRWALASVRASAQG